MSLCLPSSSIYSNIQMSKTSKSSFTPPKKNNYAFSKQKILQKNKMKAYCPIKRIQISFTFTFVLVKRKTTTSRVLWIQVVRIPRKREMHQMPRNISLRHFGETNMEQKHPKWQHIFPPKINTPPVPRLKVRTFLNSKNRQDE